VEVSAVQCNNTSGFERQYPRLRLPMIISADST
jgi:hypothetical protein